MLSAAVCLLIVFAVLVSSEYLWRRKILRGEGLRKSVHMSIGIFIAFWPWLMSWQAIQLISLAFLVAVLISRRFRIFHALFSVKRPSYGDIYFAMGIGLAAAITTNKIFFMTAILIMAIADGLAAVIGRKYGQRWQYVLYGQSKTVIGSMAFWLITLWILGISLIFNLQKMSYHDYILAMAVIPPILMFIENFSYKGMDNLLIPVVTIALLNMLAS